MSQLPALLGQNQPIAPITIDMFGVEGEGERQQNIFQHAMNVVHHLQLINASAIQMCIYLHLCREEFRCTGEEGWEDFCKKNFESYGLSIGNTRTAIRTGKALLMISSKYDNGELPDLRTISRSALFVFGDAPVEIQEQLLVEMTAISEEKGKAPTAAEVHRLSKHLQEAEDEIREKDAALFRYDTALKAREEEASALRKKIDKLQLDAKTPIESLVHVLPPGVESATDMKRQLDQEIQAQREELAAIELDMNRMIDRQYKLKLQTDAKQKAFNALQSLEADLNLLTQKYSELLLQKIRNADPQNIKSLTKFADRLRAMADHLAPSMI